MEIFQSAQEKCLCQDYDLFRANAFFFEKVRKNMATFSGGKKKNNQKTQQNHSYCNSILLLFLF